MATVPYPTDVHGRPLKIASRGGRKTSGLSVRRMLELKGVTTEEATRMHLDLLYAHLSVNPSYDITTWPVNPANPNGVPLMG